MHDARVCEGASGGSRRAPAASKSSLASAPRTVCRAPPMSANWAASADRSRRTAERAQAGDTPHSEAERYREVEAEAHGYRPDQADAPERVLPAVQLPPPDLSTQHPHTPPRSARPCRRGIASKRGSDTHRIVFAQELGGVSQVWILVAWSRERAGGVMRCRGRCLSGCVRGLQAPPGRRAPMPQRHAVREELGQPLPSCPLIPSHRCWGRRGGR
jgi:hypothetical protein